MACYCPISASSQPRLLGRPRVQAPNPVRFPGTWPLPGPPPPMAPADIMPPGSASLPETPRLVPLLPVRTPGLGPMNSQPPAPPVSLPAAHPSGGPGAPCASAPPATDLLTPQPGQSSPMAFPFRVMASLSSLPHYHLESLFPQAHELGLERSTESVLVHRETCGTLQLT